MSIHVVYVGQVCTYLKVLDTQKRRKTQTGTFVIRHLSLPRPFRTKCVEALQRKTYRRDKAYKGIFLAYKWLQMARIAQITNGYGICFHRQLTQHRTHMSQKDLLKLL